MSKSNYSDEKNPHRNHIHTRFMTLDDEAEIDRHYAWKEGYLAGEKARFTEEDKRIISMLYLWHASEPDEKRNLIKRDYLALLSLKKKVLGE